METNRSPHAPTEAHRCIFLGFVAGNFGGKFGGIVADPQNEGHKAFVGIAKTSRACKP